MSKTTATSSTSNTTASGRRRPARRPPSRQHTIPYGERVRAYTAYLKGHDAQVDPGHDRTVLTEALNEPTLWPFVMEVDSVCYNLCTSRQPLLRVPPPSRTAERHLPVLCKRCGYVRT